MNLIRAASSLFCGFLAGWILNQLIFRLSLSLQEATREKPSTAEPLLKKEPPSSPATLLMRIFHRGAGKQQISISTISVEIITALLWLWAFSHYDFQEAVLFVIMTGVLTVITWVDGQTMFIPLSMILTGLGTLVAYNLFFPGQLKPALWGVTAGIGYLGGMMLLTSLLFRKQTMGYGDLQLIVILGAWLGAINVLMTVLAAAVISLVTWIVLSMKDGFDRDRPLPFGPFLSTAGVMMYMLQPNWERIFNFLG
ncbi:MAG: prepilin peptidase [FCB group bacterium]|nr:prepilin peptidase [FCB group bacterium]